MAWVLIRGGFLEEYYFSYKSEKMSKSKADGGDFPGRSHSRSKGGWMC